MRWDLVPMALVGCSRDWFSFLREEELCLSLPQGFLVSPRAPACSCWTLRMFGISTMCLKIVNYSRHNSQCICIIIIIIDFFVGGGGVGGRRSCTIIPFWQWIRKACMYVCMCTHTHTHTLSVNYKENDHEYKITFANHLMGYLHRGPWSHLKAM